MIEIGRVCIKIAGRDSGKKCVIVDILDDNYVLIDGSTRRRKCNIIHLEPSNETIKIDKGASHDDIKNVFKEIGEVKDTKPKEKSPKPKQIRKQKTVEEKEGKKKEIKKDKQPKKAVVEKALKIVDELEKKVVDGEEKTPKNSTTENAEKESKVENKK